MRQLPFSSPRALICLGLLLITGCDCNTGGTSRSYGDLAVIWRDAEGNRITNRDATYDFGLALVGDSRTLSMTLRNNGPNKLTLSALVLDEGDEVSIGAPGNVPSVDTASFEVEFDTITLDAAQQRDFQMRFVPRGLKGSYRSRLVLSTEGSRPEDSKALITLLGEGEKGACDLPSVIDFGKTPIGETLSYAVPYLNPTRLSASGSAGAIEGVDATSFGYGDGFTPGPVEVPAQGTTDVIVTFSPTEMRAYEAQVTLRGAGECPEQVVTLRGQGSNETLTWSPTSLSYGYVNPGDEAVKEVVFINPASVPITVRQITSTNAADFYHAVPAGSDATVFTVPGNGVPTPMKIACNPSQLGPRSGTLTFQTGLTQNPAGTISLSCTGGGPSIRVTPRPTLAFGRVGFFPGNTTFSVQRKVNVQNVGSRPPTPDPTANLYLGQVDVDGTPGQLPLFELAAGANTDPTEFSVQLASPYDQATGLEAVAGRNFVDLAVKLQPLSVGMKTATLTLYSNDPVEPTITLTLTADVQQPPPCTFITSPAQANFGLVAPGVTKDLPITITNTSVNAGDTCYLSGIELGAGSDLAYSIVGGNVTELELQPQQSYQVVVRVAPTGATPTTLQTLTGQLVFNSTSAAHPQVSIPLRTSIGPACLTVAPDPMDFGTVRLGCYSARRTFSVYNTCSAPVTINSFAMQAPAGQPPGGPDCPGSTPCPEFHLVTAPTIPPGGLTLQPGGSAPVTFQASYSPIDLGSDSGAVAINAIQNGQSITYLVGLVGRGDTTGTQVDTYTQDLQPRADILLVVDDSCSMADKQAALGSNFGSFIQYAVAANVDYRIGVTTTTENARECDPIIGQCFNNNSRGPGGQLVVDTQTQLKWVTPNTPGVASVFSRLVNVGTGGGGYETGLSCSVKALTPPVVSGHNAGFLRADANLAVVVITDASDQSSQPVSYYQDLLVNVKGYQRLSYFTFSTIGPSLSSPPSGCSYDDSGANSTRYRPIVQYTSGVFDEICNSNWAATLQNLGRTAFGFRTQFYLQNQPDAAAGMVVVRVNGQVVPGCAMQAGCTTWWYDAATNSIKFAETSTPQPGVPLEIQYTQNCYGP